MGGFALPPLPPLRKAPPPSPAQPACGALAAVLSLLRPLESKTRRQPRAKAGRQGGRARAPGRTSGGARVPLGGGQCASPELTAAILAVCGANSACCQPQSSLQGGWKVRRTAALRGGNVKRQYNQGGTGGLNQRHKKQSEKRWVQGSSTQRSRDSTFVRYNTGKLSSRGAPPMRRQPPRCCLQAPFVSGRKWRACSSRRARRAARSRSRCRPAGLRRCCNGCGASGGASGAATAKLQGALQPVIWHDD